MCVTRTHNLKARALLHVGRLRQMFDTVIVLCKLNQRYAYCCRMRQNTFGRSSILKRIYVCWVLSVPQ